MIPILILWLLPFFPAQQTTNLHVIIKGFDNDKGRAMLKLTGQNGVGLDSVTVTINNRIAQHTFRSLPAGAYAISTFHDANKNAKLDRNILGIPVEKYGFSNDARALFSAPSLESQLVDFPNTNRLTINIQ